jgi:methionine sulfoxide reductase heme-binding subunit
MALRGSLAGKAILWAVLALPAAHILFRWFSEDLWPDELVAPTGLWSARMIIIALMLTPLSLLLPRSRAVAWLTRRRRAFGVAAFAYALFHLAFYVAEMETLRNIVAELGALGIWTGWLALLLMLPLALTSNDAAMRALKAGWKRLQRLAYPVALLTLLHWIAVHDGKAEALLHFAPLAMLQLYRTARRLPGRHSTHSPA